MFEELEEHQTTVHFHDYLDTYTVPYDKKSEGRPDWEGRFKYTF